MWPERAKKKEKSRIKTKIVMFIQRLELQNQEIQEKSFSRH